MRRAVLGAFISGLALALPLAPPSFACGYHDPSQVAAGILNWVYPKALYVKTAVWQAERAGVLEPRKANEPKDLFVLQRTAARLLKLAEHVSQRSDATVGDAAFSVVLIDSMMWTRFQRDAATRGWKALVHVAGPEPGDVVIVSHGKVVSALALEALTAKDARTHGLIRYYGPDGDIATLRQLLETSLTARRTVAGEPADN